MLKHEINIPENLGEVKCKWNEISSLWGVSPTGPIHLGYDSQILMQKEGIKKGIKEHTIIIADLHTIMDKGHSMYDIKKRGFYFEFYLKEVCKIENTKFIFGSEFQTRPLYIEMMYSILPKLEWKHILEAMPSQMRRSRNYAASSTIYPVMQCLDVLYNKANFIYADTGQRKIYNLLDAFSQIKPYAFYSRFQEILDTLHIAYYPLMHDIYGMRLVESTTNTRISVHDNEATLKNKIMKMFAPYGSNDTIKANALLETYKYSVFPWLNDIGRSIRIDSRQYDKFQEFENDYIQQVFHPNDAKEELFKVLKIRLAHIQSTLYGGITNWIDLNKLNKQ
ncbi:MAG: hypothetical protein KDD50_00660 [Bdellovibrionales bacterium]|nr:hypothetical protein [Bdellovibrionales bacterium]